MSETRYDKEIELFGQEKGIEQLELLFKLYTERENRDELIKELIRVKKSLKYGNIKDVYSKVNELKQKIQEYKKNFELFSSKIGESYNIFDIKREVEETTMYMNNLNKEYKKGKMEITTYETTRIDYAQKIEKGIRYIKRLKLLARPFFNDLKCDAYILEEERTEVRSERLERRLNKSEYLEKKEKIEKKKAIIRKKLRFLNSEIFDYYYNT